MFLLISSYAADLIFGDPEWLPHPVRWIGKLINILEKKLRRNGFFRTEWLKGIALTFAVVGISTCATYLLIRFSTRLNPLLGSLAWVYVGYTTLSIKDLQVKSRSIVNAIENNSVPKARRELSKIVGRDTQKLDKEGIVKSTIESIAESINDGIVAPLFYLILGGPVLAIAYKSINTLDSMVGYKNERHLHFGWFSARLDDLANYIPARISGFLIACSSVFCRKNPLQSFMTMIKDGRKHPSPNSGLSEAAMAGALGIRLGGTSTYNGIPVSKPHIGQEKRSAKLSFINEALTISFATSILMISIGLALKWLI